MATLPDRVWKRHSNPWSGWTRVPTGAVMVAAVHQRDLRLLLAALVWTVVNPLLFSPPEDESAWMTRAVLAERWWIEEGHSTVGTDYPNVCNAVGALGFLGALLAAWRRRPRAATVGVAVSVGFKLWWLAVLVRRYDAREE